MWEIYTRRKGLILEVLDHDLLLDLQVLLEQLGQLVFALVRLLLRLPSLDIAHVSVIQAMEEVLCELFQD